MDIIHKQGGKNSDEVVFDVLVLVYQLSLTWTRTQPSIPPSPLVANTTGLDRGVGAGVELIFGAAIVVVAMLCNDE